MSLQYLKEEQNNTITVVVPISDWEKIIKTYPDIILMLEPKTDLPKKTMKDFRGCLSDETAKALQEKVEQSRNEWE